MNKLFSRSLPFAAMLLTAFPVFAQDHMCPSVLRPTKSTGMLSFVPFATDGKNFVEPQTAEDIDRLVPQDTYALPWNMIWESNILFKKRVWRIISADASGNAAFSNSKDIPTDNRLARLLIKGFFDGKYKAYSASDDRFTKVLSKDEVIAALTNNRDVKSDHYGDGFNPDRIDIFLIKEDWLYLATERIWVVRIVGIAPARDANPEGPGPVEPLFWIYYPDVRNYLAQQPVYGSGKSAAEYNWDMLFEGRNFSSAITKIRGGFLKQPQ